MSQKCILTKLVFWRRRGPVVPRRSAAYGLKNLQIIVRYLDGGAAELHVRLASGEGKCELVGRVIIMLDLSHGTLVYIEVILILGEGQLGKKQSEDGGKQHL